MVHKRDIRHDPSGDVVDLSGAVQAMELNNELDPEEGGARRAGVQYHKNKIGKERTGVTHLVHAWTMQGQKVRRISLWDLAYLNLFFSLYLILGWPSCGFQGLGSR
jgi:hypothetical protein